MPEESEHEERNCSICLGTLGEKAIRPYQCTHKLHRSCFATWNQTPGMQRICPQCRAKRKKQKTHQSIRIQYSKFDKYGEELCVFIDADGDVNYI